VKDADPIVIGKTCKYCSKCELIMCHQFDLDEELARAFGRIKPDAIGTPYLVLGTVQQQTWKAARVGWDLAQAAEDARWRIGRPPSAGIVGQVVVPLEVGQVREQGRGGRRRRGFARCLPSASNRARREQPNADRTRIQIRRILGSVRRIRRTSRATAPVIPSAARDLASSRFFVSGKSQIPRCARDDDARKSVRYRPCGKSVDAPAAAAAARAS
jgi:hypothetical protein